MLRGRQIQDQEDIKRLAKQEEEEVLCPQEMKLEATTLEREEGEIQETS